MTVVETKDDEVSPSWSLHVLDSVQLTVSRVSVNVAATCDYVVALFVVLSDTSNVVFKLII